MKKKKDYNGDVTDELREIYHQAWKDGIWLHELGNDIYYRAESGRMLKKEKCASYLTAAGSIRELENIEKKLGKKIDINKLTLGDVIGISLPGTGQTREESCRNAIQAYKEHHKNRKQP